MKEFEGLLAKPIADITQLDVYDDDKRAELLRQKAAREEALIRHFEYRPDEPEVWYKVALCLAEMVVPAYRPPRGRPKTPNMIVEGWACLWVTLRLAGVPNDTEAFQHVSQVVGMDVKTVRERLKDFRENHPKSYANVEARFRREIEVVGVSTALRYANAEATRDPFAIWVEQEDIRFVQGRAPSPQPRTYEELWDYAERKK